MLPLETLPGWPEAEDPSVVTVLLLLLFIPVALSAIITVPIMARKWLGHQDETQPDGLVAASEADEPQLGATA